ncbi:MAG TPA: PAS domain-containing protein, partial [Candidatus Angelobacter sp.]|nr:PAS domain-containing protein [Candidatus Angelobacter sp.]
MRQTEPIIPVQSNAPERMGATSSLIDRAPFGICRGSLVRDRLESINPALCDMLGYTEAEMLNMSVRTQLYGDAPNRAELVDLLRRDRRLNAQETYLRRKDGSHVRVRVTAYASTNEIGKLDRIEAYVVDLTEQSVLEQQIRAVQKLEAVGRLAGGVAHDFNNILLVIRLSTEMMLGQVTPDNPLARSLLQVSQAADRAAALTKQMLAFSRRQVMQARVVNISTVVNDTLHML